MVLTFTNKMGDVIRFVQSAADQWVIDFTGCYGTGFAPPPESVTPDAAYSRMDKLVDTGWTEVL